MPPVPADRRHAVWLSDPGFAAAEIARGIGYGAFDLADLERNAGVPARTRP
jgi:4-hydroxy-2-oxoheptanedioate aldolase